MIEPLLIDAVMRREGWPTFTNHPADRGGPTKGGITLAEFQKWRPGATVADLEALSEAEGRAFYWDRYVVIPRFDRIRDIALRGLVVDAAVNHGAPRATKWLQLAADVNPDRDFGPISQAAVNAAAPLELFLWLIAYRLRLYGRLVQRDPELMKARQAGIRLQAEFAEGWNVRAAEFLESAARSIEIQHTAR